MYITKGIDIKIAKNRWYNNNNNNKSGEYNIYTMGVKSLYQERLKCWGAGLQRQNPPEIPKTKIKKKTLL